MILIYWASIVAALGWSWIVRRSIDRRKKITYKPLVRYTRIGGGVKREVDADDVGLPSISQLIIVALLVTLPFVTIQLAPTWVSIIILVIDTIIVLIAWFYARNLAVERHIEVERTEIDEGKAEVRYTTDGFERHYSEYWPLLISVIGWLVITLLFTLLSLTDWVLIAAINIVGIVFTYVYINLLRSRRRWRNAL